MKNGASKHQELIKRIAQSLVKVDSAVNQKKWAQYIVKNKIPITDLKELFHCERKVSMRFTWLLGDILEVNPEVVYPCIPWFFRHRDEAPFENFDRSMAKMLWLAGVPPEIEGEAIDVLFHWVMDPKIKVSTKVYAVDALCNLCVKHPGLVHELRIVIGDQMQKNSIAFIVRAKRVLARLDKIKINKD